MLFDNIYVTNLKTITMQKLINIILTHPNLFHPSTTITPHHLNNNYLRNHLQSINDEQNLLELITMLNNLK